MCRGALLGYHQEIYQREVESAHVAHFVHWLGTMKILFNSSTFKGPQGSFPRIESPDRTSTLPEPNWTLRGYRGPFVFDS
jgi:hypothetical protein